jgi:hypothetical protein
MPLHGLFADMEVVGDGFVCRPGDDALKDLTFPWGDLRERRS